MGRRPVAGFAIALAALLVPMPDASSDTDASAAQVERAAGMLFGPDSNDATTKEGVLLLLDAVTGVATDARVSAGVASKLSEARRRLREISLPDETAVALLGECYREVQGRVSFRVPETIRKLPDVTEHARRRLESAQSLLRERKPREALPPMLETLLAIMTPIEAGRDM